MGINEGLLNEQQIIQAIDGKTYYQLNANLQHLLYFSLPALDRNKKIKCFKAEEYTKPDICISQDGKTRYISVKHASAETVHEEQLSRFIQFLMENEIDEHTIETFLLYHFGDGTTDGTGKNRMDHFSVFSTYGERIKEMNEKFNESKDFIIKFADRVLFQGVNELAIPADIIYHGDEDFGVFMSKNQFIRHLEIRKWDYYTSVVHIGPFVLRPRARYPGREIKNDDFRHRVVVNYPKLVNDIMYIFKRYKF